MTLAGILSGFRDGGQELVLPTPLLNVRPTVRRLRWAFEAISGAIYTERSSSRAFDVTGDLRFISAPQVALEFLEGRIGASLTYYEERPGDSERTFPCILVSVTPGGAGEVGLDEDPSRAAFGEYALSVRLRRIDGGTFAELLTPGSVGT